MQTNLKIALIWFYICESIFSDFLTDTLRIFAWYNFQNNVQSHAHTHTYFECHRLLMIFAFYICIYEYHSLRADPWTMWIEYHSCWVIWQSMNAPKIISVCVLCVYTIERDNILSTQNTHQTEKLVHMCYTHTFHAPWREWRRRRENERARVEKTADWAYESMWVDVKNLAGMFWCSVLCVLILLYYSVSHPHICQCRCRFFLSRT